MDNGFDFEFDWCCSERCLEWMSIRNWPIAVLVSMHWIRNKRTNEVRHLVVMTWRGILASMMVQVTFEFGMSFFSDWVFYEINSDLIGFGCGMIYLMS